MTILEASVVATATSTAQLSYSDGGREVMFVWAARVAAEATSSPQLGERGGNSFSDGAACPWSFWSVYVQGLSGAGSNMEATTCVFVAGHGSKIRSAKNRADRSVCH